MSLATRLVRLEGDRPTRRPVIVLQAFDGEPLDEAWSRTRGVTPLPDDDAPIYLMWTGVPRSRERQR